MDPIGASNSWHWEPYESAYVTIDGKRMPSVPGGGHHGGGLFINAWDMARFGYLFLHNGEWDGRRLISTEWITMARTPGTGTNPDSKVYGFMNWFLNVPMPAADGTPGRRMYPSAPQSIVCFRGNGNTIWWSSFGGSRQGPGRMGFSAACWRPSNRAQHAGILSSRATMKP
jgi:CubicO group peptidase (beta-lactamase class C family)